MITIGDTILKFSGLEPTSGKSDEKIWTIIVTLERPEPVLKSKVLVHIDENPIQELLNLTEVSGEKYSCYWKSECENFIISKENGHDDNQLVKINLTIDEEEIDSMWDVNFYAEVMNDEIVIDKKDLINTFNVIPKIT